jgi:hypothetical protein
VSRSRIVAKLADVQAADEAPRASSTRRVVAFAEENAISIAVVCEMALILAVLSPRLFVGDSWMTLVAGREIARDGIPERESLTILAAGERWIDQQWLAQLVWYGAERFGGLAAVALLDVVVVAGAYASAIVAARLLGASSRAAVFVALACLLVAPWSWNIRAQPLALPLFIWVLYLAASHVRRPSSRILWALPLLLVWGNVHGSVVLGACLVATAAIWVAVARRQTGRNLARPAALVVGAWVCALATPYGVDIARYYHLLLVDPPFGNAIVEWERTGLEPVTAIFFVVAALSAVLVVWKRKRVTPFEIAVLAVLFAGALEAVRGVAWFALAVMVLVPNALDGVLSPSTPAKRARANLTLACVSVAAAAGAFVFVGTRHDSWFEQSWPRPLLAAVESAGSEARVFPSDRHADWLLWNLPGLRGRLAYDTRFELYDKETFDALLAFSTQAGEGWQRAAEEYDVVVIHEPGRRALYTEIADEPGARITFQDGSAVVIERK